LCFLLPANRIFTPKKEEEEDEERRKKKMKKKEEFQSGHSGTGSGKLNSCSLGNPVQNYMRFRGVSPGITTGVWTPFEDRSYENIRNETLLLMKSFW